MLQKKVKFYPYEKGRVKDFSHAEGAGGGGGLYTTSIRVVLTPMLEVLILL